MTPALMPNEAYANCQYCLVSCHICTMPLRNYRQTAQQKAGCGVESLCKALTQVCMCACVRTCTDKFVEFIITGVGSS